jgi:hypothetical protein
MTRLKIGFGKFSFDLQIPTEIGKFLILGAVACLFIAGFWASVGVSTVTSVSPERIIVTADKPSRTDYAEVKPVPTDRIQIASEPSESVQPEKKDRGYYVVRWPNRGDADPDEGAYTDTHPKCPEHTKNKWVAKVCGMSQEERLKNPLPWTYEDEKPQPSPRSAKP